MAPPISLCNRANRELLSQKAGTIELAHVFRICGELRKMEGQNFVDFVRILPEEVLENILCRLIEDPLSNEDLTNCTFVCENWNERISSNSKLWKMACQKLGLNVAKDTEEVDFKSIFLRMKKRLQKIKNGDEVFYVEDSKCPHFPAPRYCHHNGIVAIGSVYSIRLLKLEPRLRVLSRVDIVNCGCVLCIHFDDSYLVVGTDEGYVITFKMPTMEKLHTKRPFSCSIHSLTFNKDIDLLVTASKETLTFWCLSSGSVHFTRTNNFTHDLVQLRLISTPDLKNGWDYLLLCMHKDTLSRIFFDSQQITTAKMNHFPFRAWYELHDYLTYFSSYFRNPFLYFVKYLTSKMPVLWKFDSVSCIYEEIARFNCVEMLLVGVGEKYACLLQEKSVNHPRKLIIYDLETKSEVTSCDIPNITREGIGAELCACLVNGSFLDGFDGVNDKGVVLVSHNADSTYVVKWRK